LEGTYSEHTVQLPDQFRAWWSCKCNCTR